jgi:hypothetical protein
MRFPMILVNLFASNIGTYFSVENIQGRINIMNATANIVF